MKSMTVNRIGAVATGAVMLGAALAGAASATFDNTGLTEGFFYDGNYNPIVQVVVGEKGLASDSVAAGNIAATIGNLAYTTTMGTAAGSGSASGQVVVAVTAMGATGKYEQESRSAVAGFSSTTEAVTYDSDSDDSADFYNDKDGLKFTNETYDYERGEFISYSLACDQQTRTEAGVLKEATYNNIHCLFCETLCLSELENPSHDMKEKIEIDATDGNIIWYEDGIGSSDAEKLILEVEKNSIRYIVETDEVPMQKIQDSNSESVDFEWRGKMLLFGQEYYVKDIDGNDEIYLAKGKVLEDISSEGYTSEYMGYKFKIDHLIYSGDYEVAGILLDVEKPDGTVVQTQISKNANGIVDDVEISGVFAEESDAVATASVLVYDTTTNIHLEDGEDLELGGEVKQYWRVTLASEDNASELDISDYSATTGRWLENVTIQYRHDVELEQGQSLEFPVNYKFTFTGFATNDFRNAVCSGDGEGNILVEKDGDYELSMSFTTENKQRLNGVRLDQGPMVTGDMFMLGGKAWKFDDATEKEDDITLELKLEDMVDGGTSKYDLTATVWTGGSDSGEPGGTKELRTVPFVEETENNDTIEIEADDVQIDSGVYVGTIGGVDVVYDNGDLYLDISTTELNSTSQTEIGVSPTQIGTVTEFDDNRDLSMWAMAESGTNLNVVAEPLGETNDVLLIFQNADGEYYIVDFYDRDYDRYLDTDYQNNVLAADTYPANSSDALAASEIGAYLNDDRDTTLWLPEGGDWLEADYGGDYEIESVEICHPTEQVDATFFIGTSQEETLLESIITEADVGTEKTAGCCTFLVKEFGVEGQVTGDVEMVTVNPVGSLVVSETAADTTKNLVIVGGPSVNGMTTATADEINAASQHYIVKLDGKKLVVAGWTAQDTVDAGNALISWLQDNVH